MEMKEYLPPQEDVRRNIEEIYNFCVGQVAAMHSLSPQESKTKFIGEPRPPPPDRRRHRCRTVPVTTSPSVVWCLSEVLTTLPLFGANVFLAQKVSQRGCPSPCMVNISQDGLLFLHPTTQVTSEAFGPRC